MRHFGSPSPDIPDRAVALWQLLILSPPATSAPAASEPHAENAAPAHHADSAEGAKEPAP